MRILHVLHTSLPYICGYSIRSDYILRYQKEQGFEPAVVTSGQHPNEKALQEDVHGFPHWRTPTLASYTLPVQREWRLMRSLRCRVEQAIDAWKPALIHAHSPMLVGLPALAAARHRGLPLVYEVRDLWENASVDRGKFTERSLLYRIARRLETCVLRRSDAVVTICQNLRHELEPRVWWADRLFVVDNGVNADRFAPDRDGTPARRHWKLDDKRIISYIGTFQPYEGLETLISAMPYIVHQLPDAHLVITGSGGQEDHLRSLVCNGGLDGCVTFTGRLPHDQVIDIYAMADLMVYPRILTRTTALTTPLKPLEAMAMGKAVLVSDVPAMQELVHPGITGLMFHAGDVDDLACQCVQVLQSPDRGRELGNKAREWILWERQWPHLVARYRDIYKAVLKAN
jgi:PEP-CTERM/exosortase A-associated glycosyltransferase